MEKIKRYFERSPVKFFLLISLIINFEFIIGPYSFIEIRNVFNNHMVFMKTYGERLLKFGLHSWDPSVVCGNVLATHVHANLPFHPFYILATILPLWSVYHLWMIISYFVASYGMYLYLSRIIKISQIASLFGGILFLGLTTQINIADTFV